MRTDPYNTFEINGFEFESTFIPDSGFWDLSWLGEYSDTPGTDAVDRKYRGDMDRGSYRYFNPTNTIAELREWYTKHGYSKHEAHELAKSKILSDYAYSEELNSGTRGFQTLKVSVSFKGHELGSAYIGECDDEKSAISDYETDMAIQALTEAIDMLTDMDSKPKTLAKAQTAMEILKAKLHTEYLANRRTYFVSRIKAWRNLSHEYQNNRTATRHYRKNRDRLAFLKILAKGN